MPELPEVESIRRGLDDYVAGKTIGSVEILDGRSVRYDKPRNFVGRLEGSTLLSVRRRGKFLWFPLQAGPTNGKRQDRSESESLPGSALLMHLGMSGQALICSDDVADQRHLKVRFTFSKSQQQLRFVDQRVFGYLSVDGLRPDPLAVGGLVPKRVSHIAADPLEEAFDLHRVLAVFRSSRRPIKRLLLDQRVVSGVGNIYADEALWEAKIHYNVPANTLTARQTTELMASVKNVMVRAIERGGTSFDRLYVNVNGKSGYFSRHLNAYGREGKACPRHEGCGGLKKTAVIVREPFMNRSSFYCPACQGNGN